MRIPIALSVCLVLSVGGACLGESIIIDDGPDGGPSPGVTWVGSWSHRPESGTWAKPHSYDGTGSHFAVAGGAVETATYQPTLARAGTWGVSLWWPQFDWTENALVQINHAGGTTDLRVDQQESAGNYGQWNSAGFYTFDAGTTGNVVISSDGVTPGLNNVGPVADAVRFTYLANMVPLTATASSTHPNNTWRLASNTVDGSGMSDGNGDGIPETHASNQWGYDISWMTHHKDNDTEPWIKFDLGGKCVLDEMRVWNFNLDGANTNRGVNEVDIYVSSLVGDPGEDFTDPTKWTLVYDNYALTEAPGANGYDTPDVISLWGWAGRWVAMDIESNFGGGANFYGLSEVQITREVPEPATIVLVALSGLGLAAYRRRRSV